MRTRVHRVGLSTCTMDGAVVEGIVGEVVARIGGREVRGKGRGGEAVVLTVLEGKGGKRSTELPFGLTRDEGGSSGNWSGWPTLGTKGGSRRLEWDLVMQLTPDLGPL